MISLLRATVQAALTSIALTLVHSPPANATLPLPTPENSQIQFLPSAPRPLPVPLPSPSRSLSKESTADRTVYEAKVTQFVQTNFDLKKYHHVGVQTIQDVTGRKDHLLLILHSATSHRADVSSVRLNSQNEPISIETNYQVRDEDIASQPRAVSACPDPSVQFIAFAPNNIALELQITQDVANSAKARGLKTVELYTTNATRANYLAYMSCPNLKGNFYDGDANPSLITTYDGMIGSSELANLNFNHHVTNIWLACQAFNDPMLTTMIKTNQSQKYAAGQNDLLVGPSDRTAACTMNAALRGQPMSTAFQRCYQALDVSADHWGFDGDGSDYFGQ